MAEAAAPAQDPLAVLRSRRFLALLAIAAPVGVLGALISWGFLELVFHLQQWVFTDLPEALGYKSEPLWWSLPVLGLAGAITAAAGSVSSSRSGCGAPMFVIFRLARETQRFAAAKPFLVLPAAGLAVAGLAIAFAETADKGVEEVLFSGQGALPSLVANPEAWSLSALALLCAFKGIAYGLSLGSFRGGPVFPAMFLGAAAGLMAAQLPGL